MTGTPTASDDRRGHLEVEAVAGAVAVHRGQEDLTGTQPHRPGGPLDHVDARRRATTVGVDLPSITGFTVRVASTTGVDGDHHALVAELLGDLGDQTGTLDGRRVDRHLVGAGSQQAAGVVDAADAAADRERDEHLLGGAAHDVDDGVASIGRRR